MSYVKEINLRNFRNFKELKLNFKNGVNLILGKNGEGKTSILEAISLCISGSSFRPGKYDTYISFDTNFSNIKTYFKDDYLNSDVEFNFLRDKKSVLFNSKKISINKLQKKNHYILFSPESLSVIKNGPDERRNLIDELLKSFSLENIEVINNFKKSLKSRNKILRDFKKENITYDEAINILNSLDELYLKYASELTHKRIEVINQITPFIKNAFQYITGSENVDIFVDYLISSEKANEYSLQTVKSSLQEKRATILKAEMALGSSLVGPHKHDIQFLFNGSDSRYYCSQGQQRALILAFKMAQIVYHYGIFKKYPILLLDDVMSELDETKRHNLLNFLKGINAQIFITTTEFDLQNQIDHSSLSVYKIVEGKIFDNNSTGVNL